MAVEEVDVIPALNNANFGPGDFWSWRYAGPVHTAYLPSAASSFA